MWSHQPRVVSARRALSIARRRGGWYPAEPPCFAGGAGQADSFVFKASWKIAAVPAFPHERMPMTAPAEPTVSGLLESTSPVNAYDMLIQLLTALRVRDVRRL